jgi:hypothetical protein
MCPLDKPYAIDNKVCGTCPILFSYASKKCTNCPDYFVYLSDERKCQQAIMIVNFTDTSRILVN